MPSIPSSMMDRGPVPGTVIITLLAQEAANEGTVVTFGTAESSCKKCGATDVPVGWSQGKMVADETASIHLYSPMWKGVVADDSAAISFGDPLDCATGGTVKKAVTGDVTSSVFGYALQDAVAGGYVLMFRDCCATATASS